MPLHTNIATATYRWFDENKVDNKVSSYFDSLLFIFLMAHYEKPKSVRQLIVHNKHENKTFQFSKTKNINPEHFKKWSPNSFLVVKWAPRNWSVYEEHEYGARCK